MRQLLFGSTSLVLAIATAAHGQTATAAHGQTGGSSTSALTSWAGVAISPIAFSSALTRNYVSFMAVPPGSGPDINPADPAAWTLAFVDNFAKLSVYDAKTGTGTWLVGSPDNINGEAEFYPTAAEIAAVGNSPFTVSNGGLGIALSTLDPRYAADVQNGTQLWQSGRLDTSKLPGLYSEGGQLYIEVTARVPSSPYAWPAFWGLARDAVYPLEYDAMEVFGAPQTSYDATIHYTSPEVTGNNVWATRIYPANGADLSASYHVYGFLADRRTRRLSTYFDHHLVGTVAVKTDPQGFDKEVYLILDEATGGLVPSPTWGTSFPITFAVRQVAAYYNVDHAMPAPVSGLQPETGAYLARLAAAPSAAWAVAFNNMIVAAKNLGFFSAPYRPAHWWMFATDHEADAMIDLMNPNAPPLSIGGTALTWTADRGFVGNGGRGWLDTGVQLAGADETNNGMGAWITRPASTPSGGGLIETRGAASDVRLETTSANGVVYDLGSQYGAQSETAPDTNVGWFGMSTFADPGSTYADSVTLMAGAGNAVRSEQIANMTRLPASDVLLLDGTDGAATIVLGNQWHQPRQMEFRDRVLAPFLKAIGAVPN